MDERAKEKKLDTIKLYIENADGLRDIALEATLLHAANLI